MKRSLHLIKVVFVLSLVTGLLFLSSCGTDVQQKEISLKGEKITASSMQALNKTSQNNSDTAGKNNTTEIYEVNTNSPKIEDVKQKLKSILEDSLNKASNKKTSIDGPQEPSLEGPGEPNLENAVIAEDSETNRDILVTPIDNGDEKRTKITVSGYNETTNSTEKTVIYTAEGNYTAAEIDGNPQLAEQAEVNVTIKSQTGQILYSHTFTAQDYDDNGTVASAVVASNPFSCYWDCMTSGGGLNGWLYGYTTTFGGLAGQAASSSLLGAALTASAFIGLHLGCYSGCLASWLWFDVFNM